MRNCGIYCICIDGVYNAPFVALDDLMAKSLVISALKNDPDKAQGELHRIGTFDFFDGIIDSVIDVIGSVIEIIMNVEASDNG